MSRDVFSAGASNLVALQTYYLCDQNGGKRTCGSCCASQIGSTTLKQLRVRSIGH